MKGVHGNDKRLTFSASWRWVSTLPQSADLLDVIGLAPNVGV